MRNEFATSQVSNLENTNSEINNSHWANSTSRNSTRPTKPCTVCGDTILWRRWLARDWEKVLYCGASCRRAAVARARTEHDHRFQTSNHHSAESAASAA